MRPDNPLIVQPDRSLMLHTVRSLVDADGNLQKDSEGHPMTEEHPRYAEARDRLAVFAELTKSPDYLHTYRLSTISVWNAAALGVTAQEMLETLEDLACVPIPPNIATELNEWVGRYGVLRIERGEQGFELVSSDPRLVADMLGHESVRKNCKLGPEGQVLLDDLQRGLIKQALIRIGFPVDDRGGYLDGDPLEIKLRSTCLSGDAFALREYQNGAAQAFHAGGTKLGGSGVVVLPCGAGKTVTGMAVMALVGAKTLILTTNTVAVRQWREELLDKTELTPDQIGEYTGEEKIIKPVTITTYQMLTWRRSKASPFEHMEVFSAENWGLVIYDEVHLLPAPVFRVTADLQARRRLGLTATLIREDGKEDEVFCLIGPKRYDVPWKVLESKGFIATASCVEVRVPLDEDNRAIYLGAGARAQFRVSSENPAKVEVVQQLIQRHPQGRILVIGQYIEQLESLARTIAAPLITGKTPNKDREVLYDAFKAGKERILIVSKVGNFAIDLPDANVAIQISGTFGSRQEEAQRLGRILRPKKDGSAAVFYSVVTAGTRDQEFAEKRQLFLTEQGYTYKITEAARMCATDEGVHS